jgi:hypothetical protein
MKKYTMFMAIGALLAVAQVQAKQHFSLVNKLDVPITVSVWGVEGSTVQELIKEFTLSAPHKNRFKGESFDILLVGISTTNVISWMERLLTMIFFYLLLLIRMAFLCLPHKVIEVAIRLDMVSHWLII